jgi:hypothetical protein
MPVDGHPRVSGRPLRGLLDRRSGVEQTARGA